MSAEPTVFVVDDDPAIRKTLTWLVRSVGLAVETYESAGEFLDAYQADRSGCLVLDARLQRMSGFELLEKLGGPEAPLPIIMITAYADFSTAVRALKGGAVDILRKPYDDQELLDRIWQAIERDRQGRAERAERAEVLSRFETLTAREREVVDLLVAGRTSPEIASSLGLSARTVEGHRARIMGKMGADSVAALVRMILLARPAAQPPS
jgi:two-component system response regulator FixJ